MGALLAAVQQTGVDITDIQTRDPSLEDVFLDLIQ
jgi:hypothetical protein